MSKVLATGMLLMNGNTVEWPPLDMNGVPVAIGQRVECVRDTFNGRRHFTVGSFRLQYRYGELDWVLCAHDDADRYYESWASDCRVIR